MTPHGLTLRFSTTTSTSSKKNLDDAGYGYSVDKYAMSINDEPFNLTIAFEPHVDVSALQRLFNDNEAPKLSRTRRSRIGRRG
jgi:hypothetical protein